MSKLRCCIHLIFFIFRIYTELLSANRKTCNGCHIHSVIIDQRRHKIASYRISCIMFNNKNLSIAGGHQNRIFHYYVKKTSYNRPFIGWNYYYFFKPIEMGTYFAQTICYIAARFLLFIILSLRSISQLNGNSIEAPKLEYFPFAH